MNYICTKGFIATNGRVYHYNDEATSGAYRLLTLSEKSNFKEKYEDNHSTNQSNNTIVDDVVNNSLSLLALSNFDSSPQVDNSSSFGGFGGGDFGGGGASSDF
jgi:uncharacterized membrane protein YgcG